MTILPSKRSVRGYSHSPPNPFSLGDFQGIGTENVGTSGGETGPELQTASVPQGWADVAKAARMTLKLLVHHDREAAARERNRRSPSLPNPNPRALLTAPIICYWPMSNRRFHLYCRAVRNRRRSAGTSAERRGRGASPAPPPTASAPTQRPAPSCRGLGELQPAWEAFPVKSPSFSTLLSFKPNIVYLPLFFPSHSLGLSY